MNCGGIEPQYYLEEFSLAGFLMKNRLLFSLFCHMLSLRPTLLPLSFKASSSHLSFSFTIHITVHMVKISTVVSKSTTSDRGSMITYKSSTSDSLYVEIDYCLFKRQYFPREKGDVLTLLFARAFIIHTEPVSPF